jgi:hypothetical protein
MNPGWLNRQMAKVKNFLSEKDNGILQELRKMATMVDKKLVKPNTELFEAVCRPPFFCVIRISQ